MATAPQFASIPEFDGVALTNTTIADVFTAGDDGALIDKIRIAATGNTSAGRIQIFHQRGAKELLLRDETITAITASTTVKPFYLEIVEPDGLGLKAGDKIRAQLTASQAVAVHVSVQGGSL